ncbi:MAG: hypothetical protein L0227_11280 [Chloroflexi bacterium]|nr:hypothetical protein [Chloroflexota bacterium]
MSFSDGSSPEVRGARRRVADVLARFEQIDPEALSLIALTTADAVRRDALRSRVHAAAARTDRLDLLAEAETEAKELVFRRYSESGLRPQPFGLNWLQSLGTAPDRAATGIAVVDAVAVVVVEDELADDDIVELSGPFETLVMANLPGAGAVLVGLGGRPAWVRGTLLVLAVLSLAAALAVTIALASPLGLLGLIVPILLIAAVVRSRPRPPASGGPGATPER